jgi:hypothetical protein
MNLTGHYPTQLTAAFGCGYVTFSGFFGETVSKNPAKKYSITPETIASIR